MSPRYETAEDIQNELAIVAILKKRKPEYEFIKMPAFYPADFKVNRFGKPHLYIEMRTRKNSRNQFPTIILDKAKVDHLFEQSKEYECGSFFVVRWTDALGYCHIASLPESIRSKVRMGGREKPRKNANGVLTKDPNDITPVVDIPVDLFTLIPLAP